MRLSGGLGRGGFERSSSSFLLQRSGEGRVVSLVTDIPLSGVPERGAHQGGVRAVCA